MEKLTISDLHIVLIEPSSVQSRIIKTHLKKLEVSQVTISKNGKAGLAAVDTLRPDLVICSMYLDDMSATDVVLAMRNNPELEDIPFMLISSETSFAMLDPLRQAGVVAILPKPFDDNDLRQALDSTVNLIFNDEDELDDIEMNNLQVLVVDDSLLARKHISRVLNNIGINNITTAENGVEAVKLIKELFFDLVVTDYNMPEMDGETLTRFIREQSQQRTIPVLMVTSEEDASRLSAVQQAGVSGICDKPFDINTVKQLIHNIMVEN